MVILAIATANCSIAGNRRLLVVIRYRSVIGLCSGGPGDRRRTGTVMMVVVIVV